MRNIILLFLALSLLLVQPVLSQSENVKISLVGREGQPADALIDGNMIRLQITLPAAASTETAVEFTSPGVSIPLARCTVKAGESTCQSEPFAALGWYWDPDGKPMPLRTIQALVNGTETGGSLGVNVSPRPVVMVHGFNADFHAWDTYLGSQGYLAELGLRGFAVGDGQVDGVLLTGSLKDPFGRTNSIAQNATVLHEYIRNVQEITGAEQVDVLVHSMGGMITRYYLDRVMAEDNVAQLIILGTPMAGSSCAILPAALGILLPATIEIQPSYMLGVFNQQIIHRRGVPFHALAGAKLLDTVQSPCTPVPSDLVVTVDSVKAIPMPVDEIALLHIELNTSREVFDTFVTPLLQTQINAFESPADPPAGSNAPVSAQFSQVFTGHISPGETKDLVIPIDAHVTVANFALYDTSRSLDIVVTGASGNQITLDPVKNGVIKIDDPSTMIYLGYGFKQPNPGKWMVTLKTTASTPAAGADFALAAQFSGGAKLETSQDKTVPRQGETVTIRCILTSSDIPIPPQSAQAVLRKPGGQSETREMKISGNEAVLAVTPDQSGIYGIEIKVAAQTADGFAIDRAAFLAFEAQPSDTQVSLTQGLAVGSLALLLLLALVYVSRRRR